MTIPRMAAAVLAIPAILVATATAQKAPPLADLLRVGGDYIGAYPDKVSGTSLEELYTLVEVSSGRMMSTQRIGSDVLLLNLNGKAMALRDAFAIDTQPIREHTPRVATLLAEPTAAAWQQVQNLAQQTFKHFMADLVVRISDPMVPLQLLAGESQALLTWKIDGQKKMDGVAVTGLRFQEPVVRGKQYLIGTPGNASASGRFWIDPANGTVHMTEFWLESPTESSRTTVTYAENKALGLWLPASTNETYEVRVLASGPSNMGAGNYGARQSFEGKAVYTNAKYLKIDMSRVRR